MGQVLVGLECVVCVFVCLNGRDRLLVLEIGGLVECDEVGGFD